MTQRQLTANQAQDLREDRGAGVSARALAAKYGISRYMVGDIIHGKTYQDVGGPICGLARKPRLTPTAVIALREEHAGGVSRDKLAEQYDIPRSTMWDILTGISWTNVGGPLALGQEWRRELDVDEIAVERALEDIVCDVPLSVRLTEAERNEVIRMVPIGRREVARVRLKVSVTTWGRVMAGAA
jgi:hypothetical protein